MGNAVYPRYKAWKANGVAPAAGYFLHTYESGTLIPKTTYSDASLTTANANPVVLDANGEAVIFLDIGDYRFDLKTPLGALINTFDPVIPIGGSSSGSGSINSVNNIEALKALTPTTQVVYNVLGYNTQGDLGGGLFYFAPASTAIDDGGYVIAPDSAPAAGRWIRLNDRPISAKFFGWTGTGGAFDTAALAAMAAYAEAAAYPGYYTHTGQVKIVHIAGYDSGLSLEYGGDQWGAIDIDTDVNGMQLITDSGYLTIRPVGVLAVTFEDTRIVPALPIDTAEQVKVTKNSSNGSSAQAGVLLEAAIVSAVLRGTGGAANEKVWTLISNGTTLELKAMDDTGAGGTTVITVDRTGSTPDALSLGCPLIVAGIVRVAALGSGLEIAEGSNARMGIATLVGGAVVVSTTEVTANSRIFITSQVDGGTPGWLRISARSNGVSFTITSSSGSDTSQVAWMIVEPAP
jgi:hypothetical protein